MRQDGPDPTECPGQHYHLYQLTSQSTDILLQIALLLGQLSSLSLHINSKQERETTTEVEPIFIPEEFEVLPEAEAEAAAPEETLEIYDDNFPSLFGRVTPTRIQETIHELTTLKGADGEL